METKDIGFLDKFVNATDLIEVVGCAVVTNAQEHAAAGALVNTVRDTEKALEAEYKALPIIIEAKRLQGIKSDLAARLEAARKSAKGLMMKWEDAQEAARVSEENRLQAIAKQQAEDEALTQAQAAQDAGNAEEAEAIISEPLHTPTVVLPKTVAKVAGHVRSKVKKWKLRLSDGTEITSDDFRAKVLRVSALLAKGLDAKYFMVNHTAISGVVDSLGKAAEIHGILTVWEVSA